MNIPVEITNRRFSDHKLISKNVQKKMVPLVKKDGWQSISKIGRGSIKNLKRLISLHE